MLFSFGPEFEMSEILHQVSCANSEISHDVNLLFYPKSYPVKAS